MDEHYGSIGVIFLAGGSGLRFKSEIPKQFIKLKNKPIALHSFEIFLTHPEVQEIVIVTPPEYQSIFVQSLRSHNIPYHFAIPGDRRQDSLENGLKKLSKCCSWVCTHDGARPFISNKLLNLLFAQRTQCLAATLGISTTSTIKECDSERRICKTLSRDNLWEIQTPQLIERNTLEKGFQIASQRNLTVTDDVALAELLNAPSKVILSSPWNLKITTKEDFSMAEKILEMGFSA